MIFVSASNCIKLGFEELVNISPEAHYAIMV